jgi:apolipoprotein N-acyltransferase
MTARRPPPRDRQAAAAGAGRSRATPRQLLLSLALATASGVLWFLSCADFDIWPLAWFAMVPALWVLERAPSRRRGVLLTWLAGIVANLGGFYWLAGMLTRFGHLPLPLALLGLLLLAVYQAVVFLLFALVLSRIRQVSRDRLGAPLPMALLAPLVMVSFEILVPFIFPWYLAITQAWLPPVIQIAELTGPVGVSALLMAVNGAIYDALTETEKRRRVFPGIITGAVLTSCLLFGLMRLQQVDAHRAMAPTIQVGVVQGNIGFDEKGLHHPELAASQLSDLQSASADLARRGADLVLWSESSYPYTIPRDAERDAPDGHPRQIARGFAVPLIFGAVTRDRDGEFPFNSALMLDAGGEFVGRFDKIYLLIFGEYIPLLETFPFVRKLLPSTAGHFARGQEIVTFPFTHEGKSYRLGPMICYEDIIPSFGRKLAALHPHLLVNLTNDAWFGDTSEPWEHMALSVYRAVEVRSDLVRAVNTGVSAFIDAGGRVHARTYAVDPARDPRGVDTLLADAALLEGGYTFYARFGDVFGYLCVLVTAGLWLVWPRLRPRA